MGPRPNGRGKQGFLHGRGNPFFASMGPRPNGRGKFARGVRRVARPLLQWGRGQTAAERSVPMCFLLGPHPLQWGRGQTAAESSVAPRWPIASKQLQWGRGQTAAESWCAPVMCRPIPASMGPRPNGRGKWPPAPTPCSSWSGFNGAAAKRPRKVVDQVVYRVLVVASMGPRPNGRGKTALAASLLRDTATLQWGRGQTAAESIRSFGYKVPFWSFNGAAAKRPRKGINFSYDEKIEMASMGPRPNGRGKLIKARVASSLASRFNGAAAKRPRKDPP